ncbi:MAG: cadherin-like domain-containing protein, partial [Gammaproteobacteria bacterium]|nr:cadherin-like domain-containing protein [Gammaproteobacteria bacterium]
SYTVVEGAEVTLASVVINDSDPESSPLSTVLVSADGGATSVAVNGANTLTTALGGIVKMNEDGTFSYTAPVRDHDDTDGTSDGLDQDSFVYKISDGLNQSDWTTVNIDITDTVPDAFNDTESVDFGSSISGNVILENDTVNVDTPVIVTEVAYDGVTYESFDADGKLSITTDQGVLTINQDGSYDYQSTQQTAFGGSNGLSDWANLSITGFNGARTVAAENEFLINPTTQEPVATNILSISGSASLTVKDAILKDGTDGIGIAEGAGSADYINGHPSNPEAIMLDFGSAVDSFDANFYSGTNSGVPFYWSTYDQNGDFIQTGSGPISKPGFSLAVENDNAEPFQYVAFYGIESSASSKILMTGIDDIGYLDTPPDIFSYTIEDADGDQSTANLTINFGSTNAPNALKDSFEVNEDSVLTGSLADNDRPSDDGGNVWSVASNPSHGTVSVNADGTFSYTPDANYNGEDSFTYTITDIDGDVSTATVTINVAAVNDLPEINSDSAETILNSYFYINDGSGNLAKVNLITGATEDIVNAGRVFYDIASDQSGAVFGITARGDLYSIDDSSGATSLIGDTGFSFINALGVGTDDVLYGISNKNLFSIDKTTGDATFLKNIGYDTSGDVTVIGDTMYLSSTSNQLIKASLSDDNPGQVVGPTPSNLYGLIVGDNDTLLGVSNGNVYLIDQDDATTSLLTTTSGVGVAYGAAQGGLSAVEGAVLANDVDLDNDVLRVDGIGVGILGVTSVVTDGGELSIDGNYGTLKMHSDGSYEYDIDITNEAFSLLGSNDLLNDVFTYSATDGTASNEALLVIDLKKWVDADNLVGSDGDDILVYDDITMSVDGQDGSDTLYIAGETDVNANAIDNIETINLEDNADGLSLNVNDVLDMTDTGNVLFVDGDASNSVSVSTASGEFAKETTSDIEGYDLYVGSDGADIIKLYVAEDITII